MNPDEIEKGQKALADPRPGPEHRGYHRPTAPYVCGRGSFWRWPCPQGPTVEGGCSWTSECTPFRKGDRWECRRPKDVGGPCSDGPSASGQCARSHPPCHPRPSLRTLRGRITLLTIAAVLATLLATFELHGTRWSEWSALDPGPLSDQHRHFSKEKGCAACHQAHGTGAGGWVKALFEEDDLTGRCLGCHSFEGTERLAHGRAFEDRHDLPPTRCTMCHTEHRGAMADLVDLDSDRCNSCHRRPIDQIETDHPEFPPTYPHRDRTSIKFDHAKHYEKHFVDTKTSRTCTGCHTLGGDGRFVAPGGFETACARCHLDKDVMGQDLVLLELPEDGLFASPVTSFVMSLLGHQELSETYDLLGADGPEGLAVELGSALGDEKLGARLLEGLVPELVEAAVKSWSAGEEYGLCALYPVTPQDIGWRADARSLRYRPRGHPDPQVRAWIEMALARAPSPAPPGDPVQTGSPADLGLRDRLLDPETGPGRCFKCHAVSERVDCDGNRTLFPEWTFRAHDDPAWASCPEPGPEHLTRFDHRPHLRLAGQSEACGHCHVLKKFGDHDFMSGFAGFDIHRFQSNFAPIRKVTCTSCHSGGEVRNDCRLCHVYHSQIGFQDMMSHPSPQEAPP